MKRFDIDSFIARAKTLDLVDLIIFTNDEIARASLYLKCLNESSSEWIRTKGYLCFIQNTLHFFQTGGNILLTEPTLRSRLQPVIEALSQKNQLLTS
ncbi:hypothetical protein [Telluribacter humicola]|uniref:hypothetical protein n=1 Tax=Telluribacter humicola TaxID=1720261 RepID=UPI001A965E01|nr:hypothetical protein [Telluribacter humicola]